MENQMFCYQCQETAGCSGCTRVGVCGKQPDVAAMQDLLVYATKGISAVTTTLRQEGVAIQPAVNHMITLNLFTTITNANFSKEAIIARIQETLSENQTDANNHHKPKSVYDGKHCVSFLEVIYNNLTDHMLYRKKKEGQNNFPHFFATLYCQDEMRNS